MSLQAAPFLSQREKNILHSAGYTSVWQIANVSPVELWRSIRLSINKDKESDDDDDDNNKNDKKALTPQQQQRGQTVVKEIEGEGEEEEDNVSPTTTTRRAHAAATVTDDQNKNVSSSTRTRSSYAALSLKEAAVIIERCLGSARKAKLSFSSVNDYIHSLSSHQRSSSHLAEDDNDDGSNDCCTPTPLCTIDTTEGGEGSDDVVKRSVDDNKNNNPNRHQVVRHIPFSSSSRPMFTTKTLAQLLQEEENASALAITRSENHEEVDGRNDAPSQPQNNNKNNNNNNNRIVTFSETIDELCGGGGVECGCVTEICGAPGMGKTQMAMQLAVAVQLPKIFGGLDGDCLYIDTEGSFVPSRFAEIASGAAAQVQKIVRLQQQQQQAQQYQGLPFKEEREEGDRHSTANGFTTENILKRLHYIRVTRLADLLALVESLPAASHAIAARNKAKWDTKKTTEAGGNPYYNNHHDHNVSASNNNGKRDEEGTATTMTPVIKLIIIDSIAFHFRSALGGDAQLRSRTLFHVGQTLQRHANAMNAAIVVTNQLTSSNTANNIQRRDSIVAASVAGRSKLSPATPAEGGESSSSSAAAPVPALGDSWAQNVTYRLLIQSALPFVVQEVVQSSVSALRKSVMAEESSSSYFSSSLVNGDGRPVKGLNAMIKNSSTASASHHYNSSSTILQRAQTAVSAILADGSVRTMTLVKSPSRGRANSIFRITSRGIRNVNVAL